MSAIVYQLFCIVLCAVAVVSTQSATADKDASKQRLRDAKFRCCWIYGSPYNYRTSHPVYGVDGANMKLFLLLKELTNFQCATMEEFKPPSNTGWMDYIKMTALCTTPGGLVRNTSDCPCDIASGTFFPAADRDIVDFLPANILSEHTIFTHMRNTKRRISPWLFVNTFRPLVWASIAAMALTFTVVKFADAQFAEPVVRRRLRVDWNSHPLSALRVTLLKSRTCYRLRKAAQSSLTAFLGKTPSQENRLPRHWLLNYIACLFGLILVLSYESAMTAILVQEKTVGDYETYSDLLRCSFNISDVCYAEGDSTKTFFEQIRKERDHKNCAPYKRDPRLQGFSTYDELFAAVNSSTCKYGMTDSGYALWQQHGRYCGSLVVLGDSFARSSSAMIVPKNWPYYDEMRAATLKIIESGAVHDSVKSLMHRETKCTFQNNQALTFDRLQTFFIVVGSVWMLLFLAVVFIPQSKKNNTF